MNNAVKATVLAFVFFYLSLMSPFMTLALMFSLPVGYFVYANNIDLDKIVPSDIGSALQSISKSVMTMIPSQVTNMATNIGNNTNTDTNTDKNERSETTVEGFSSSIIPKQLPPVII